MTLTSYWDIFVWVFNYIFK